MKSQRSPSVRTLTPRPRRAARGAVHGAAIYLAARQALVLGMVAAVLAGCVSVGVGSDGPARVSYRLHDPGLAATSRLPAPAVDALLIQPLPGDAMADTVSLPYARRANEFAYYQLASWTERPVRQVPRLLQQRLEARGVAQAVGLLGDPLRADWLLTLTVDSLHHDVSAEPGLARSVLTAELFDRRTRQRVARQRFEASPPAERADSAAAAAALSQAVARNFDALLPWLEGELKRANAGAAGANAK
jgi:ABC-type uncharacterized transport system auxiliary subunit